MHDRARDGTAESSAEPPSRERFRSLMVALVRGIGARALDGRLERWLNDEHGPGSSSYEQIFEACLDGIREGWMCARERGGIRHGRVLKPSADLHEFSVDVVDMANVDGPHHVHPEGEIDLVMPLSDGALFDGHGPGWCVYPPASSHTPTVSDGHALVLYLLPHGSIVFTGA